MPRGMLPFLLPLFGVAMLATIVLGWHGGGAWWAVAILPAILVVLIVQSARRSYPRR